MIQETFLGLHAVPPKPIVNIIPQYDHFEQFYIKDYECAKKNDQKYDVRLWMAVEIS